VPYYHPSTQHPTPEAGRVRDITFDSETFRVSLHVLAVCVWVGGQIVVGAIVPALRRKHPEALSAIAKAFGRIGWPFFALAIFTGIWNMASLPGTSAAWNAALGIKLLLVALSGVCAWFHQSANRPAVRGITAGIALVTSVAALVVGVMLST
jgi:putative copper export protein